MKPSCHNHKPYVDRVSSHEFPSITYDFRQSRHCGHWPGGNAVLREGGDDVGGKSFDWAECSDCKWKGDGKHVSV